MPTRERQLAVDELLRKTKRYSEQNRNYLENLDDASFTLVLKELTLDMYPNFARKTDQYAYWMSSNTNSIMSQKPTQYGKRRLHELRDSELSDLMDSIASDLEYRLPPGNSKNGKTRFVALIIDDQDNLSVVSNLPTDAVNELIPCTKKKGGKPKKTRKVILDEE